MFDRFRRTPSGAAPPRSLPALEALREAEKAEESSRAKLLNRGGGPSLDDAVGSEGILSSLEDRGARTEQPNPIRGEGQWEKLLRAAAPGPYDLWRHA